MWAGIAALVLLAGVAALAPLLLDEAAVKRAIEPRISAALGGEVRYESFALSLLPRPRVRIRGLAVSVPQIVDGRIATVDIRMALLPLITGDIR
ncbi:MAG: hypothetical protein H6R21_1062, partial [Proteobacteria bacterium]|nr:hypothetical protein [Pseudomonadota bacterium]